MRHPVVVEVAGGREALPADAALVGLLAAVDPPEIHATLSMYKDVERERYKNSKLNVVDFSQLKYFLAASGVVEYAQGYRASTGMYFVECKFNKFTYFYLNSDAGCGF